MLERLGQRAEISDRVDDNPGTVQRRLKTFAENNEPVVAHLEARGPVHRVSDKNSTCL